MHVKSLPCRKTLGRATFDRKTRCFCMIFLSGAYLSPWACLDAWMPGCQDAWSLKSMICSSKMCNSTFLNFRAIRLVPYSNLSHSLFNPHLSSLVPLKIVQVELEKHGFRFKTYEKPENYKNSMYEIKVLGCGDGIPRCRLFSHTLCHQFQPIFSEF